MRTIHKFPVHAGDQYEIDMPEGAEVLTVDTQLGQPYIWAAVEDDSPVRRRRFAVRGTGHDCAGLCTDQYVGTFQLTSGRLVFHLFDLGES